jgi:hypothetical protein
MIDYFLKLNELEALQNQRKLTDEEYFMLNRVEKYLQALKYDMKYFVYQGGICPDTLDFCRKRNNNVYSIDELMKWKEDPDKPNIENYDPILHLGGNKCFKNELFCNHDLSFINEFEAKRLRSDLKINEIEESEVNMNDSLDPKIKMIIENKKNELYIHVLPHQKWMVDRALNIFANEVLGKNEKLMKNNIEISMEEALEEAANSIIKIIELTKFQIFPFKLKQ